MTSQPEWYESWMSRTSQMLLRMDARIEQNEKLIARMDTQIEQGKRDAEKDPSPMDSGRAAYRT